MIRRAYVITCDSRIRHECSKKTTVMAPSVFLATLIAESKGWRAVPAGSEWPNRFMHECPGAMKARRRLR